MGCGCLTRFDYLMGCGCITKFGYLMGYGCLTRFGYLMGCGCILRNCHITAELKLRSRGIRSTSVARPPAPPCSTLVVAEPRYTVNKPGKVSCPALLHSSWCGAELLRSRDIRSTSLARSPVPPCSTLVGVEPRYTVNKPGKVSCPALLHSSCCGAEIYGQQAWQGLLSRPAPL
ncbi:hypothetical protein RRG08_044375 [Elysia crispata]|uniref:Uncharacterized protein n=1 Tax=Elysia crispata TaxID=231223 RepID=A0AAE1D1V2_9GAST|nr:hypothetical protein RRG08_044375 [Elysia crispata]